MISDLKTETNKDSETYTEFVLILDRLVRLIELCSHTNDD